MSTATFNSPLINRRTHVLSIFLRESRYEFIRLLRTRSFSFSVVGFPVVFYLFFGIIMNRGEHLGAISVAKYVLASYAVFGWWAPRSSILASACPPISPPDGSI